MKMNYMMKQFKQFTLATVLATTALTSAQAFAGDRVGNGGDSVATHFYEIATRVSKVTASVCQKSQSIVCRSEEQLQDLIAKRVTIYSEQTVEGVDGRHRDAINNDKDSITVSRSRWEDMELSYTRNEKRVRLVIHEYLSILGLESSDDYSVSTPFIQEIKDKMFDIGSIAGKYEKNKKTILEYKDPVIERGGEHIMFLKRSDKDGVCRILTNSLKAKVLSYTTRGHVVAGRGLSFAKVRKDNIKVITSYLSSGSTIIEHIVCIIE